MEILIASGLFFFWCNIHCDVQLLELKEWCVKCRICCQSWTHNLTNLHFIVIFVRASLSPYFGIKYVTQLYYIFLMSVLYIVNSS